MDDGDEIRILDRCGGRRLLGWVWLGRGLAVNVRRLGVYYAFWLPIAILLIALEVTWRRSLLRWLKRDAHLCPSSSAWRRDGYRSLCQRIRGHDGWHVEATGSGVGKWDK